MNKQLLTLGFVAALAFSTAVSMAENTIYTDGIGRLHFLGKDPASNSVRANYTNPAEQDLTRRLYENTQGDVNFVDYKIKDYDNTFGIGRMDTQTMWRNKFSNNVDDAMVDVNRVESSYKKPYQYEKVTTYDDFASLGEDENNVIGDSKSSKAKKKSKKKKSK